jgi:hypothetical protein
LGRIWGSIVHRNFPITRNFPDHSKPALPAARWGLATAPGPADAVLVIRAPPESGHTIYDTFDDEKRVI